MSFEQKLVVFLAVALLLALWLGMGWAIFETRPSDPNDWPVSVEVLPPSRVPPMTGPRRPFAP